jgi:hypothetical protein
MIGIRKLAYSYSPPWTSISPHSTRFVSLERMNKSGRLKCSEINVRYLIISEFASALKPVKEAQK